MKVEIRDWEALASLSLVSLLSYLRAHEWINDGPWGGGRATMYLKEHGGLTHDILVPVRDTVADYAESMAEAVTVLATVEERSQLDVFHDLEGVGADVIRMRPPNGVSKGSLSLRQSTNLLNDAYDMLASAARAVDKPQAAYRGRLSAEVADYLDNVQSLPGYYEGYALTLHSPVPAGIGDQGDFGDDYYSPFPRRTTHKLAQALERTNWAIDEVIARDTLEPFEQAVQFGVSANLCDSVAALAKKGQGIEIGLSWADVRPSDAPDSYFRFSEKSANILTEAAKSFRSNEPSFDERVMAQVVELERKPREFDGRAVILSMRDGRLIRIKVEFERSVYDTVIQAFQEQKSISLDGDIHPSGSGCELRNPRNLTFITA